MAAHLLTQAFASACSSDGSIIVGQYFNGVSSSAGWWDSSGIPTALNVPAGSSNNQALGCSSDGLTICGSYFDVSSFVRAALWDKTTGTETDLPGSIGTVSSQATACSGNGNIIVGTDFHVGGDIATWWDKSTQTPTALNNLVGGSGADAFGISSDGTIVVGTAQDSGNNAQPVWWNQSTGVVTQMTWPGSIIPSASGAGVFDCSSDGSIIVGAGDDGSGNPLPVWWDKTSGTSTTLNQLAGANGAVALGVSDDGSIITGWAFDSGFNRWAVVWNKTSGAITQLPYAPGSDLNFAQGNGISGDASVIVGFDSISSNETGVWWDAVVGPSTPIALLGRSLAGGRSRGPLTQLTILRGRSRAGGRGSGLVAWPSYSLPIEGISRAGGRSPGGINPIPQLLSGRSLAGGRSSARMSGNTAIPVFPNVPAGFPVSVSPSFASVEGMIPSGRGMRAPQMQLPVWNFEMNFEVLRDQTQNAQPDSYFAGITDFVKLSQIFISGIGQYGRFLFNAPWDNSRTNQVLGIGDGTNKEFLIQRTWGFGNLSFTEPVGALNVLTSVAINGIVQNASTYTVSPNVITFFAPGSPGAVVTATFSFYYLCQFSEDQHDYSEFLTDIWSTKIKFRSLFPELPINLIPQLIPFFPPQPIPLPPIIRIFSPREIHASSSDGSILWGVSIDPGETLPFAGAWWDKTTGTVHRMNLLPDPGGSGNAWGCSSDGSIGVGYVATASNATTACWWNQLTGVFTLLNQLPGGVNSVAFGCSSDASVIVGYANSSGNIQVPVWWDRETGIITQLNSLPGNTGPVAGQAQGCTADGTIIVGSAIDSGGFNRAVWWDRNTGTVTQLNSLIGYPGTVVIAYNIDDSGNYIVGSCADSGGHLQPVWWDRLTGIITQIAIKSGDTDGEATDISANGVTIIGYSGTSSAFSSNVLGWSRSSGELFIVAAAGGSAHEGGIAYTISANGLVAAGDTPAVFGPSDAAWWSV